jgi:NTP pyrophosphatase (non-canonical NTP hydrolase)
MDIMFTIKKAIKTYGKEIQLAVAVEELSELIKEICKNKRGFDNKAEIIEEMADCYIVLMELQQIFSINTTEVTAMINKKIKRLEESLRG